MSVVAGLNPHPAATLLCLVSLAASGCAGGSAFDGAVGSPASEAQEYRVFVANESSDIVNRVVFDAVRGARVEREISIGIMPADTDGPHGVAVSPDGQFLYVTVAHGTPDGWLWKFSTAADSVVDRTTLGRFPATIATTPDGQVLVVANFNLHGDPVRSDLSIVYSPDLRELARIPTCVTPHGSRINASGRLHYSACLRSDQVVETSLTSYAISRRFSVRPGDERILDLDDDGVPAGRVETAAACGPTWVTPGSGPRAERFVYIACNAAGQVLELDVLDWVVTRRFDAPGGPYNMAITPDGSRLVVTLRGGQAVMVLDLESGDLLARAATSQTFTHGVVVTPDGRYAMVTNEAMGSVRGTLDVFDLRSFERVASVELVHQPGGIDFWRVDPIDASQAR